MSCCLFPAFAARQNNTLSADEFYTALKEEYLKCGLTLDVGLPNDTILYTTDMLEEESQLAHRIADGFIITVEPAENISTNTKGLQRGPMEADFAYSRTVTASCNEFPLVGTFKFKVDISGLVDLANHAVMSVDMCRVRHVSSTNVESYDLNITYSIYLDYSIQYRVTGDITYSWTEPHTNVAYKVTKDVSSADNFYPLEHI